MKHFETELPQGYVEAKTVDAKSVKFGVLMNVAAVLIIVAVIVVGWLLVFGSRSVIDVLSDIYIDNIWLSVAYFVGFLVSYLAYIVLHELVHGLVYKILTKQKLTFGFTATVAYCGLPNVYVYRTAAICSLMAPFTVFTVVFLVPMFFLANNAAMEFMLLALLGSHIGGCSGDLYDTILYTFVFRDGKTLMRDTGPKQSFYVLADSPLGRKVVAANAKLENSATQKDCGAEAAEAAADFTADAVEQKPFADSAAGEVPKTGDDSVNG